MENFNLLDDQFPCPQGALQLILRDAKTGRIKDISYFKNMFVTQGKYALADALRGNVANNRGQITYMELGTGTNAPALTDVTLQTPLFRKLISVRSASNNIATFQTFFATGEANGTLKEAGLFGDSATSQLSSGTLFCHTNINRTKSSSDTLTITWNITFL